jgi:GNAT superfamily N-acetyltransferase
MTFISGFYPVVAEVSEAEKIALELIEASKSDFVKNDHTRLEIELVFPTEEYREYSKKLINQYRKCGFHFAAEEIHMKCDLKAIELPDLELPEGYDVMRFSDVPYEDIKGPAFRTLEDSKEGLYLSMSPAERQVTIEYFFDKSKPCIDDASLILEKSGDVVGFVITRIGDDGNPDIGPVGIVPEIRGQGLGSFLLIEVMKRLKTGGSTSVYLDTTVTNPAQNLYRKFGFVDEYHKQFYFWSP